MVKSMTGYGRAEEIFPEYTVTVELRSVNNRFLDCSIRLPRLYLFAEEGLKARVKQVITRGKVDVFVTMEHTGGGGEQVTVNETLAAGYLAALARLQELAGPTVGGRISVTELARFPEILTVEKREEDVEQTARDIARVLDAALADFDAMRTREGQRLEADILARAAVLREKVALVEERSPRTVAEYRARLEQRMTEVLQSAQLDPARILTEAALFADRVAVDEETVRLGSHLDQMEEMLSRGGPAGRRLDFLIQELNREANTIGSKGSDLEITRLVVDMKGEIEKIREQVQNIE